MQEHLGPRKVRFSSHDVLAKIGYFLQLDRYTVTYPLFKAGKFSSPTPLVNVHRRDAVAGIVHIVGHGAHHGQQSLLLVEQFRMPTLLDAETGAPDFEKIDRELQNAGRILELMAGVRRDGEPPLESFRRECLEETNLTLTKVVHINSTYPSPGACSEKIHLFYGRVDWPEADPWPKTDSPEHSNFGDDSEDIRRHFYTIDEFFSKIEDGSIVDGKCLCAAEWMRRPAISREFFNR